MKYFKQTLMTVSNRHVLPINPLTLVKPSDPIVKPSDPIVKPSDPVHKENTDHDLSLSE